MAVPATLSSVPNVDPYIQYVAANEQTVYPYPFPITQDSDLVVVINGVTQATDSTYSVSGVGNSTGGNVTLNTGSNAGDIITLYRDIPIERISQISQNSGFSSTVFNNEFNNFYLIAQQLEAAIAQCLQIPNTNNPAPSTTLLAANYANMYLSFDKYGNPQPTALTSSGALTAAIVGALLFAENAAESSAGVPPTNTLYQFGDALRFGADPTGAADSTTAINDALAANGRAFLQYPGTYRVDGTITIGTNQELYLGKNVVLRRMSAHSASTAPVVHVKNNYAVLDGGTVQSDNGSPSGVVRCGHADTSTSTWNSFWWRVSNVDVICRQTSPYTATNITGISQANPGVVTANGHGLSNGDVVYISGVGGMTEVNGNTYTVAGATTNTFQLTGNGVTSSGNINTSGYSAYTSGGTCTQYPAPGDVIGVYVPSSQPVQGPSAANYYGKLENVHVQAASAAFWFTDIANGHSLISCTWNGFYWYGLVFQGSYGNRAYLGFCDGAYQNGVFCVYLAARGNPGATYASSISSSRNHVTGGSFEPGTTGNYGCYIANEQISGAYACTNNFVEFALNSSSSTAFSDGTSGLNTIICDSAAAQLQNGISSTGAIKAVGPVAGALVDATPDASTFTITYTGMSSSVTGTAVWARVGNLVTLYFPANTGTSNAGTFTATGLPSAIQPTRAQVLSAPNNTLEDSGSVLETGEAVGISGSTITFYKSGSSSGWTSSGTKGVANGFTVSYLLN